MQNSLAKTMFLKKSLLSVLTKRNAGISLDSYTHRGNYKGNDSINFRILPYSHHKDKHKLGLERRCRDVFQVQVCKKTHQ